MTKGSLLQLVCKLGTIQAFTITTLGKTDELQSTQASKFCIRTRYLAGAINLT